MLTLKRLRVENYKSLRNASITLRPLTVLVGPNAAGKSNILDCLMFLSEIARGETGNAFSKRGGFTDVVWGGDRHLPIYIGFEGSLSFDGSSEPVEYGIRISLENQTNLAIQDELATWGKDKQELFRRERNAIQSWGGGGSLPANESILLRTTPNDPKAFALKEAVSSWMVYDFQRSKIAERQPVRKETILSPDGSNTATVLHWVRNEDVETFDRLESLLKTAIPEVEHLLAPPDEDGKVYVAFKEKHLPGRIPAWNLSEGSTRLVATLLALFVPYPSSLVAIEGPDASLHPYLMEYLADILTLGSKETQILITTQSPYLLNHLPPDSLLIVTKERGRTTTRRAGPRKALKEALEVLGLGEMWYAGHFENAP